MTMWFEKKRIHKRCCIDSLLIDAKEGLTLLWQTIHPFSHSFLQGESLSDRCITLRRKSYYFLNHTSSHRKTKLNCLSLIYFPHLHFIAFQSIFYLCISHLQPYFCSQMEPQSKSQMDLLSDGITCNQTALHTLFTIIL